MQVLCQPFLHSLEQEHRYLLSPTHTLPLSCGDGGQRDPPNAWRVKGEIFPHLFFQPKLMITAFAIVLKNDTLLPTQMQLDHLLQWFEFDIAASIGGGVVYIDRVNDEPLSSLENLGHQKQVHLQRGSCRLF
jgi:hypothetical protein